jgi:hypothetical protein
MIVILNYRTSPSLFPTASCCADCTADSAMIDIFNYRTRPSLFRSAALTALLMAALLPCCTMQHTLILWRQPIAILMDG